MNSIEYNIDDSYKKSCSVKLLKKNKAGQEMGKMNFQKIKALNRYVPVCLGNGP